MNDKPTRIRVVNDKEIELQMRRLAYLREQGLAPFAIRQLALALTNNFREIDLENLFLEVTSLLEIKNFDHNSPITLPMDGEEFSG